MKSSSTLSDDLLIAKFKSGDENALTEIFNRYWKRLYWMAFRRTQSHHLAEELVQELFTEMWDKREKLFNGNGATTQLSGYLMTAVKNKILNHVRAEAHKEEYARYCKHFTSVKERVTEESVAYSQLLDEIEKRIAVLPEKSQTIFRLNRLEGRSVEDIASHLKLSEKAIEYHLTKTLKALRLHLKDYILLIISFIIL